MARRSTGSRGEGGGRDTPLVQVPPDAQDHVDGDESPGRDRPRHPFEREDVPDQGAPDGRGGVNRDEEERRPEDPANPSAPVHPQT